MRVAVYHNNSDIRIEERPVPQGGVDDGEDMTMRSQQSGLDR